jgi:hypothetical protein
VLLICGEGYEDSEGDICVMTTYRTNWRGPYPNMRFTPLSVCSGAIVKIGALLQLIEREGFNVFLTGDKNMENQQLLEGRPKSDNLD